MSDDPRHPPACSLAFRLDSRRVPALVVLLSLPARPGTTDTRDHFAAASSAASNSGSHERTQATSAASAASGICW